jgi:Heterokaryon incompatibility protein (HET)
VIDCQEKKSLRIRLTQRTSIANPALKEYVTVSHSWGDGSIMKLTRQTKPLLEAGLLIENLARNLSDAVVVAWRLGFRLIWIDALCIFQDDQSDWEHEAPLMGKVYASSTLTISVTGTQPMESGCFVSRNPLARRPCCIGSWHGVSIYVDVDREEHREHGVKIWDPAVEDYPISRRAWVVQERFLSRRVVYFGQEELVWECCEDRATETWPSLFQIQQQLDFCDCEYHSHPSWRNDKSIGFNRSESSPLKIALEDCLQSTILYNEENRREFLQAWSRVVSLYTTADLTYEKDRETAILGLADLVADKTGMTYLFGLWKELLPEELLWYRNRYRIQHPEASIELPTSNYPSWTWLSHQCQVEYQPGSREIRFGKHVYVAGVQALRDLVKDPTASHLREMCNEYGLLSDIDLREAGLRIRAPLLRVTNGETSGLLISSYNGKINWLPDQEDDIQESVYCVLILRVHHRDQEKIRNRFCCAVAPRYDRQGGGHDFTEMGLVVEPLVKPAAGEVPVFRRVGFFHNNFNRDGLGIGQEMFADESKRWTFDSILLV